MAQIKHFTTSKQINKVYNEIAAKAQSGAPVYLLRKDEKQNAFIIADETINGIYIIKMDQPNYSGAIKQITLF